MVRRWMVVSGVAAVMLAHACPAFAAEDINVPAALVWPSMAVSAIGLIVAAVLLVEALGVRKYAMGGAIAERIGLVVLAIACLAAAAIAEWVANFVPAITIAQTHLAAQVLTIVAMGLLAAYFAGVRIALQAYLHSMTGTTKLPDQAGAAEEPGEDAPLA